MEREYRDCVILHVDADGFFAGVEQALNPELRGCPVVTGAERGIIAAASYEAKRMGIKRGFQLHEARAKCAELVVVPSDYEAYSLYSQRLFAVLRRFSPMVEEYSIDEAFADLSGCERVLGLSLEEVAARLRESVARELGLTVSVGISLNKTLSKLCSKFRKPNGQTVLRREHLTLMLQRTTIEKVWGLGPASCAKLRAIGVTTAHEFVALDEQYVQKVLHKPGHATWLELRGERIFTLELEPKTRYDSMMKGHTFAPPSCDEHLVFGEAAKNLVAAFAKLRRHKHLAREIGLHLRQRDYRGRAASLPLPLATAHDSEAMPLLRVLFDELFERGQEYRATMVWLGGLLAAEHRQLDLFADTSARLACENLDRVVDGVNRRYGQGSLTSAAVLGLQQKPQHARDEAPERHRKNLVGERGRRLALPRVTLSNPI